MHRRELLPWCDHHLEGRANGVTDRAKVRFVVQGEEAVREAPDRPAPDAEPSEFFLGAEKGGAVPPLNDGSPTEAAPAAHGGGTSWSHPDPEWTAGVTTFDKAGVPDHSARVVTCTTAPFDRDRESAGEGVLRLQASSDPTDMDVMAKLSLPPTGGGKPPFVKVSHGWMRASHRAGDPAPTTGMRPCLRHDREGPIESGQASEPRVELLPMSVLVREGERLRLEISNRQSAITEATMARWCARKAGADTHHLDAQHPSRLRLHDQPRATSTQGG